VGEGHRAAWHVRVLDGVIPGMVAGDKVLEGGFDFSLFKGFTMMEVGMCKDTSKTMS
jgi:hypothetical protein